MCIAVGTTVGEMDFCDLNKCVIMDQTQVTTLTVPICLHPATALMVTSVHVTLPKLLTGYELLHTLPYANHYS